MINLGEDRISSFLAPQVCLGPNKSMSLINHSGVLIVHPNVILCYPGITLGPCSSLSELTLYSTFPNTRIPISILIKLELKDLRRDCPRLLHWRDGLDWNGPSQLLLQEWCPPRTTRHWRIPCLAFRVWGERRGTWAPPLSVSRGKSTSLTTLYHC